MFRRLIFPSEVTDQEARWLSQPATLAILSLSGLVIIAGLKMIGSNESLGTIIVILGFGGIFYGTILLNIVATSSRLHRLLKWPIAILNAIAISVGVYYLAGALGTIPHITLVLVTATTVIFWGRLTAYVFLLVTLVLDVGIISWFVGDMATSAGNFGYFLLSVVVIETIQRLGNTNINRIRRLQTINDFARQVSSSLDTRQVLTLTSAALQKAIKADSYFFGLIEDDQIHLHLIYDDGEFFPPAKQPLEGTLSNWVVRNQSSLFIPDLRNSVELEGVDLVLVGKDKTSLCWMGVPMRAGHVNGIIAIASYTPNDFNRTDLELLENLAQQAALVLDNTYHHAEVEAQSRLDSLTGAYNHGYILSIAKQETEKGINNNTPLSLIMLDIDHFKQYNDNFGHLVGDQVLSVLTQTIRQNIKATDSIGRWGGEEFTILLPATDGPQARQVADRIRDSVNTLTICDRDGKPLPFPTVSQGLAVFPDEANEIFKLIDLADQRLYIAKERGRNQIEPKAEHWKYIK